MDFKELTVWKKSMNLAKSIYSVTTHFPKEEIYGLTSQMRRAAVSVSANIAEGQHRNTKGEFRQFLGYSLGSLSELETLCILSADLKYIDSVNSKDIIALIIEVRKMLFTLRKKLSA